MNKRVPKAPPGWLIGSITRLILWLRRLDQMMSRRAARRIDPRARDWR
jgi:hypothetical protein